MPRPLPLQDQVGADVLKQVSRSFYLSLKFLPSAIRAPVSLAYLLARLSDTIADAASAPVVARLELLRHLDRLIALEKPEPEEALALEQVCRSELAPRLPHAGERALLGQAAACLRWLGAVPAWQAEEIRRVLGTIIAGQREDLERFGQPGAGPPRCLPDAAALHRYTYLVAGCVGEFWTRICLRGLSPDVFSIQEPERLLELARRYGQALQLVNILRDVGEDLRQGRCYLPESEFKEHGISKWDLRENPAALAPVARAWLGHCREHQQAALQYVQAIAYRPLVLPTVLPLMLAARTTALLAADGGADAFQRKVKVPRREVWPILARTWWSGFRPERRGSLFEKLARS